MPSSKIDPGEFLHVDVLPRLFDRLPAAYPDFGWKRIGRGWRATNDHYTHEVLGVRCGRVECLNPMGFLVYAGAGSHEFWTWTKFENGGTEPKGRGRMDVIKRLAELAGADASVLGKPLSEADKAAMAARRRELEQAAAEREKLEAIEAQAKCEACREIWAFAGEFGDVGRRLAEGYMRGRGIEVDLPKSIRGIPAGEKIDVTYPNDEGHVCVQGPVVICGMVRPGAGLTALQRIYLDPREPTRKRPEREDGPPAKLTLGNPAGASVALGGLGDLRVLALTEGVETGLAVLQGALSAQMQGVYVQACVSTSGLMNFEPPEMVGLEEVVIMGDHDEWVTATMAPEPYRPGERTALAAAERLAGLLSVPARAAIPGHTLCPEMIGPDGSKKA